MAIVQTSDFTGRYKISTTRFSQLDTYIEKYEKYHLVRMLGKDLYDAFIADLTLTTPQTPQTLRFQNIFNPFDVVPNIDNCLLPSEGIKKMLIQFIYYYYLCDQSHQNTPVGQVVNQNENSVNTPYNGYNLIDVYNEGVKSYINIQEYVNANIVDYPEYNDGTSICLNYTSGY